MNAISQSLLPEFDHEMANARRLLERVPEDRLDFVPHPKSMTLARLAGHVSEIPSWAVVTLGRDEFDMSPADQPDARGMTFSTRERALSAFDKALADARALLAASDDAQMTSPWTLKNKGQVVLTMPRVAVLRNFVLNHLVHHRAQLGVYLRMNDVPVPGFYGPSADDQMQR